ncbi:MAG: asparaginyl-tRNA synthetase [Bathelium mastoideum]|nr:MAG: asparaginyl-tRNA synthetase [Bathelium mastoideum]
MLNSFGRPDRTAKVLFAQRPLTNIRRSSKISTATVAALLETPASNGTPTSRDVTVTGFVRSVRKQKQRAFVALGDGSSYEPLQAVIQPEQAHGLSTGVAVTIGGEWRPSPSGKQQSHELHAKSVKVMGQHDLNNYPLQKKFHTPEYLRTLPHLRQRLPSNALLLRLRSQTIAAFSDFFTRQSFVQTHPPIITSSDCEGAGEAFTLNPQNDVRHQNGKTQVQGTPEPFFRAPKYLTVSSQLHLEALAQAVGKVWTLSPTFRAEKSDTMRHLSEFYMLEAEVAFLETLDGLLDVVEDMLRSVIHQLQRKGMAEEVLSAYSPDASAANHQGAPSDRKGLEQRWLRMVEKPWPRLPYSEAVEFLQQAADTKKVRFEFPPAYEAGLQAEHERFLAQEIGAGSPVFVTDYPTAQKPFYMAPSSDLPENSDSPPPTVSCFDLLVPDVCEIVGGSLREHRLENLLRSMQRQGIKIGKDYQRQLEPANGDAYNSAPEIGSLDWYADLRRFGSVPHGGFGLGFDRLLCYLAGVPNIKDVVGFPRWYGRCDC